MPGQFVEIDLGDGAKAFARSLKEPEFAFYDQQMAIDEPTPDFPTLGIWPIAFRLWIVNRAVTTGRWRVIGSLPLDGDLLRSSDFFKQDVFTAELSIYNSEFAAPHERPATFEECESLECAAVWEAEHVEDRLRDHFAGRSNRWFESLRPKR